MQSFNYIWRTLINYTVRKLESVHKRVGKKNTKLVINIQITDDAHKMKNILKGLFIHRTHTRAYTRTQMSSDTL